MAKQSQHAPVRDKNKKPSSAASTRPKNPQTRSNLTPKNPVTMDGLNMKPVPAKKERDDEQ